MAYYRADCGRPQFFCLPWHHFVPAADGIHRRSAPGLVGGRRTSERNPGRWKDGERWAIRFGRPGRLAGSTRHLGRGPRRRGPRPAGKNRPRRVLARDDRVRSSDRRWDSPRTTCRFSPFPKAARQVSFRLMQSSVARDDILPGAVGVRDEPLETEYDQTLVRRETSNGKEIQPGRDQDRGAGRLCG
jgi:hypothetical protein